MSEHKPTFCVIGAGHGGLAMAGHLGLMGHPVHLYNRTPERLTPIQLRGGIDITGEISGFGPVRLATPDMGEALAGADVVMVAIPATGHAEIAELCAPHLRPGQVVILNPGRTFGALVFHQVLKRAGCDVDGLIIGEAQTFIYASRATNPGQVQIFRQKNSVPLATLKAHLIPTCLNQLRGAYPGFVPGDNVFKTSFNNIGAIFHPALVLLNAGWIEDNADFEFYFQGATPSVASVMERLDEERIAVAAALGIQAMSARQWLYFAYDAVGKTLQEAMRANLGYRGILAPHRTEMRYITEDVPCSLVPICSIGNQLGVQTPVMESLIHIASAMHGTDYWAKGRTAKSMGIEGLDLQQLRLLAIGESTYKEKAA